MTKVLLIFAYILTSSSLTLANTMDEVKKDVNVDQSVINWMGKKKLIEDKHNGKVKVKEGSVTFNKKGQPLKAELVIDMNSITNEDIQDKKYNQKLVGHLSNEDFFNVKKHPVSILKINNFAKTKVDKKSKEKNLSTYKATGDLQIKDKTELVGFDVVINKVEDIYSGTGKLVIDRTRWDIKYGSDSFFKNLGDKVISNDIEFDFNIVTK